MTIGLQVKSVDDYKKSLWDKNLSECLNALEEQNTTDNELDIKQPPMDSDILQMYIGRTEVIEMLKRYSVNCVRIFIDVKKV
jgi:hypothetical protein